MFDIQVPEGFIHVETPSGNELVRVDRIQVVAEHKDDPPIMSRIYLDGDSIPSMETLEEISKKLAEAQKADPKQSEVLMKPRRYVVEIFRLNAHPQTSFVHVYAYTAEDAKTSVSTHRLVGDTASIFGVEPYIEKFHGPWGIYSYGV
jgi:hypothetical protein